MLFTRLELEEPMKSVFCDLWLNLEHPLPMLQHTGGTSTPSTCANATTQPAGATLPKSSEEISDGGWLASVLQQQKSTDKDGVICQFISHQEDGAQLKVVTPGEIGFETCKIEIYPFNEIVREERIDWWRTARTRALVHFNWPLDPDLLTIKRILDKKAREIDAMEGCQRKLRKSALDVNIMRSSVIIIICRNIYVNASM
ncbi:unnamed protein product [Bemisia tabaci]|uniref:Uncharacterized protein n=1 Tax=Bemisia tabaci TaxID=7038 RepID=A0A9P0AHT5_BEMTA|nr:unnamed protein product [Bemisia tabaci]